MKVEIEEIVEIDLDSFRADRHIFPHNCGPFVRSLCGAIPRCEQQKRYVGFPTGVPFPDQHLICPTCHAMHMGGRR